MEDRNRRIQALHNAYFIWASRAAYSHDAVHATKVLKAILTKVETPSSTSMSPTLVPSTPNTLHSQKTHTPSFLENILNADPPEPMEILEMPASPSINLEDAVPLEYIFNNPDTWDWVRGGLLKMGIVTDSGLAELD